MIDATNADVHEVLIQLETEVAEPFEDSRTPGRTRSIERIEDRSSRRGYEPAQPAHESDRLNGGVKVLRLASLQTSEMVLRILKVPTLMIPVGRVSLRHPIQPSVAFLAAGLGRVEESGSASGVIVFRPGMCHSISIAGHLRPARLALR